MKKFILVAFLVSCSDFDKVEVEKIKVDSQELYLKKFSRGLNYEVISISKNDSENEPNEQIDIISPSGRRFYYKVKNDTLFIFDGYFPERLDLGVPIVVNAKMNVSDVMKIEDDFLNNPDTEYKLFPMSHKKNLN